jgi:hypothetical protein
MCHLRVLFVRFHPFRRRRLVLQALLLLLLLLVRRLVFYLSQGEDSGGIGIRLNRLVPAAAPS